MTMLEEWVEAIEEKTDRLETLFGQFMLQTGTVLLRMESTIAEMKAESSRDRAESARLRGKMNKRWGDLANKMDAIVEDIIAPSLRRMAREEFNCGEERFFSARISRARSDDSSLRREFDVLYIGAQAMLLNETKSTPRSEEVMQALNDGHNAVWRHAVWRRPG